MGGRIDEPDKVGDRTRARRDLLVEGFFPRAGLEEKPISRRSGFQEFGLPFAPDAAITRYLAAFLTAASVLYSGDIL